MKHYSYLFRNLGLNLLILRKTKNLNQTDIAKQCKLSRYQYLRIEGGHGSPTLESILKICDTFELQIGDLFKNPFNESLKIEKREPVRINTSSARTVREEKMISSLNKNLVFRKIFFESKQLRRIRLTGKANLEVYVVHGEVTVNTGSEVRRLKQGENLAVHFNPQLTLEKVSREDLKIASLHGAEVLLIQTVLH